MPEPVIPPLSGSEYEALKADIAMHGVRVPVIVDQHGEVVDGRHRLRAATEVGCPVPEVRRDFISDDDRLECEFATNLRRRHLSGEQLRWIALRLRERGCTQARIGELMGVDQTTVSRWLDGSIMQAHNGSGCVIPTSYDCRVSVPKSAWPLVAERVAAGERHEDIAADWKISPRRIGQIAKLAERLAWEPPPPVGTPELPAARFRCIVIDPPWETTRQVSERRATERRTLDYPTMSAEEILALDVSGLADPRGCHLYLWFLHKHLEVALEAVRRWGFTYRCLITWMKSTAPPAFWWMQNTEHAIFAQCGALDLAQTGVPLGFTAKSGDHSTKPEEFYVTVRRVSPGPRLEMFARTAHEGFSAWGAEAPNVSASV